MAGTALPGRLSWLPARIAGVRRETVRARTLTLEITVERLPEGELSFWLVDEARPGDLLDLRGPIGGYFVWEPSRGGPLLLVAGGSGLVPLMCIERHRRRAAPEIPSTLLLSARGPEDVLYPGELDGAALTYTRRTPDGWTGYDRRIDAAMLAEVAPAPDARPRCVRRARRAGPRRSRPPPRARQDGAIRRKRLIGRHRLRTWSIAARSPTCRSRRSR